MTTEETKALERLAKKVENIGEDMDDLLLLEEFEDKTVQNIVNQITDVIFQVRILHLELTITERRKKGVCNN